MLIKQDRFSSYEEAYSELQKRNKENTGLIYGIPVDDTSCINTYEVDPMPERVKRGSWTTTMKCDIPEYISPITGRPVDGRTERREELKRHGCRETDPSEFKPIYQNKRFIEKHGIKQ